MTGGGYDVTAINAAWDTIGQQLGMTVTRGVPSYKEGVKIMQPGEDMVFEGSIDGIPSRWRFMWYTHYNGTLSSSYTHVTQRTLDFHIPNVGDWTVTIQPRTGQMQGGVQTGMEAFDKLFFVATNDEARFKDVFTDDLLSAFVERGWIHLELSGATIRVIDDFMDQFANKATGGIRMMSAVHPIYGTSVSSPSPNAEITIRFAKTMVVLAKQVK